jgi:hypothetical protein
LNVRGSIKASRALLDKLSPAVRPLPDFAGRWKALVREVDLPAPGSWTMAPGIRMSADAGAPVASLESPEKSASITSPTLRVRPGSRITIDYAADVPSGATMVFLDSLRSGTVVANNFRAVPAASDQGALREGGLYSLSLDTPTEEVRIRIVTLEAGTRATIRLRRLWTRDEPWDRG